MSRSKNAVLVPTIIIVWMGVFGSMLWYFVHNPPEEYQGADTRDPTAILLDVCQSDLTAMGAAYAGLAARQELQNKELKDRLSKAADDLQTADERAMQVATALKCGENLVACEYTLWVCRKHLHRESKGSTE